MLTGSALPPGQAPRRIDRQRRATHALLLLALASLLLLSGATAASAPLSAVPDGSGSAGPAVTRSLHLSGGPGQDPLDTWVQSTRQTTLFNGPDSAAQPIEQITAWTYLQVSGPIQGPRVLVRDPLQGIVAWVSTDDVGPAPAPTGLPAVLAGATPTATTLPTATPLPAVAGPRKVTTEAPPDVTAQFAVVVDGSSGQVLYGRDPRGQVAPASLTKIVTAQLALDHVANLDEQVTVDVDSRVMYDSTIMGLTPGMTVSMRALLYGLMLPSGNDAALAIARHVAGSEPAFVQLMNQRVDDLGLHNSHFMNPHGLDQDGHYSSAYDMVMLARRGMQNPNFAALAAAKSWDGEGFSLRNLNKMLWLYPGADGVKVGYTDNSGRAIVASATVGGHRVFVGLMRAPDMLNDCTALLNYAFNNFDWSPAGR